MLLSNILKGRVNGRNGRERLAFIGVMTGLADCVRYADTKRLAMNQRRVMEIQISSEKAISMKRRISVLNRFLVKKKKKMQ